MLGRLSLCATLLAASLCGQTAGDTVLKGIYTAAQAKRGEAAYAASCARCHGAAMESFSGPALKGDMFLDHWREFPLKVLYDTVAGTMPWGAPGTLDQKAYLDIVARLLEVNEIPAGQSELTMAAAAATLLVGKNGPQPLPTSSPVATAGCMTLDTGNGWFLTAASEPARTMDQWEISPAEQQAAVQSPAEGQLFRLQNLSDLEGVNINAAVGTKILVKGIMVRQEGNPRINVTALKTVAPSCEEGNGK